MDVSIIIPTYNRLWSLPRAIESCRNTKCRTEIIVVDDGSTDGTWEWLSKQPGLVIVKQENQGQTYAINKGFSLAHGQYIRFLDSDDFLADGIIDKQFSEAVSSGSQLVVSRVDLYSNDTQVITEQPEVTGWRDFLEIQLGNTYGSHFLGMLFHRSLVEQTPRRPDFALREDRMFLLEVALLNPSISLLKGCGGYWVQHSQQMQSRYDGMKAQVVNWQHLQIYRRILAKLEVQNKLTAEYKLAACTVLWPLAHWVAKDNIEQAVDIVNWIFELCPSFKIPETGSLGKLYRVFGFKTTERILKMRRRLLFGYADETEG